MCLVGEIETVSSAKISNDTQIQWSVSVPGMVGAAILSHYIIRILNALGDWVGQRLFGRPQPQPQPHPRPHPERTSVRPRLPAVIS